MKLLQVTTVPVTIESFLLPFADHFRKSGWAVDAAAAGISESSLCRKAFNQCFDIPFSRKLTENRASSIISKVREVVKLGDYDIIHVHTPVASFLSRFALRNVNYVRPLVVYTAHGFHFGYSGQSPFLNPYYYAERLAARWTDALITINKVDFVTASKFSIIHPSKLWHVPGIGIDLAKYSVAGKDSARESKRAEIGVGQDDFLILMIAEFNSGKRHKDLLAALKLMDNRVRIALAGDGRLLGEMRKRVALSGLGERVKFLGHRRDIPDWISAADACVLPSAREGLPRSVMEAMAMERLVIGSRIRGIEELLQDDCGLLFPVGDITSLAAAINLAVMNRSQAEHYVRNARLKIESYSLSRVLEMHGRIYEKIVSSRKC